MTYTLLNKLRKYRKFVSEVVEHCDKMKTAIPGLSLRTARREVKVDDDVKIVPLFITEECEEGRYVGEDHDFFDFLASNFRNGSQSKTTLRKGNKSLKSFFSPREVVISHRHNSQLREIYLRSRFNPPDGVEVNYDVVHDPAKKLNYYPSPYPTVGLDIPLVLAIVDQEYNCRTGLHFFTFGIWNVK
jgi:hypothetical protein